MCRDRPCDNTDVAYAQLVDGRVTALFCERTAQVVYALSCMDSEWIPVFANADAVAFVLDDDYVVVHCIENGTVDVAPAYLVSGKSAQAVRHLIFLIEPLDQAA